MPRSSSLASVFIDVAEQPENLPQPWSDSPFYILVAGDFSGGAGRQREPIMVDRDNFDDVLARVAPEVRLPAGESEIAIRFRELDDFHPDSLFARLGPFQALRDLRRRNRDPNRARRSCSTEDSVESLVERGFMPLVWLKETDRVRLARFQSVLEPNAPLEGRWS